MKALDPAMLTASAALLATSDTDGALTLPVIDTL